MMKRNGMGGVLAAGAMAVLIGLAGCADPGPVGTGYVSGYTSGYSASDYTGSDDYRLGYGSLGYDPTGMWLGGWYGDGGYDRDRNHKHGRDGFVGTGHVGGAAAHGVFAGSTMHPDARPEFFGGAHGGNLLGGFGVLHAGVGGGMMHSSASPGGFFAGASHFGGGFGGAGGHS